MVADAFDKTDPTEKHNQVYLMQRKKTSFSLPTTPKLAVSSLTNAAMLEAMRYWLTVLKGPSYTPELLQHSLRVGQAVFPHQDSTPIKHGEGQQHPAAGTTRLKGGRNCSTRRRAPGRGKKTVCAITPSGCWLQKLMATEPAFLPRITHTCFPALLNLPFLILLYKQ